jgi:hypothetical protein
MIERYSIIGIAFSATIVLLDLYLLKKHKIDASTFTRWFIIGVAIGVVSLVPASLAFLYIILGTEVLISAVTVASFMTLLLLIFYLDYRLNKLNDRLVKLVALVSAQEYDFDRKRKNRNKSDD